MVSSGTLRRVALVRTDVSEELTASIIRVTRIGELGTTLAVTNNRRTLHDTAIYVLVFTSAEFAVTPRQHLLHITHAGSLIKYQQATQLLGFLKHSSV
jgi:hypothetical protein